VTREAPEGYKAGALNWGLRQARGDFIAIFDADSLPPADFLRANLPHFADDRVGVVQVRWEFGDRRRSVLSRVQSTIFDGLFAVDQVVRSRQGMPLQFNGNNGIWRRRCLKEAGPWRSEMLTEDADLSFRAYIKRWRIVHRRDYAVPTEIPEGMAAFRTQQKRWATGSAQVLRQLAGQILRADITPGAKLTMLLHLARHSIYPLIVLSCIFAPLTTLYGMPFWINYGGVLNLALLSLLTGSMLVYYRQALKQVGQPPSQMIWIPLIIVLAIGMSVVYSVAFFRGLTRRGGEFVRTPKQGSTPGAEGPRYRSPWDPLSLVEILFGAAQVTFGIIAHLQGNWINGTFIGLAGLSFLWVGLGSSAPGQVRLTGSRRAPVTSTK
jgi:cellulose synthase/poly-beta-1,6-N-acetylglucosamine synthase-like glycosyltransferase